MSAKHVIGMVLAGGAGRRLSSDKGRRLVGGVAIIDRVLAALIPVTDETIVVGSALALEDVRVVADDQPGAGPLAAICTGMKAAPADVYLVVACDMPFITSDLLRHLLVAGDGFDAVVPVVGGRDQPLCAAYGRSCLPAIIEALAAGESRVASFFSKMRLCRLPEEELAQFGSPEVLFFNVNTPEELSLAQQMAAQSEDLGRRDATFPLSPRERGPGGEG